MFLPDLLGSPMRAARGMTALTQLLPAEGHCRRFARPPQGEDTPFPKEKSGPEIFRAAFHIRFTASGRFRIPEGKKRAPPCRVKQG